MCDLVRGFKEKGHKIMPGVLKLFIIAFCLKYLLIKPSRFTYNKDIRVVFHHSYIFQHISSILTDITDQTEKFLKYYRLQP